VLDSKLSEIKNIMVTVGEDGTGREFFNELAPADNEQQQTPTYNALASIQSSQQPEGRERFDGDMNFVYGNERRRDSEYQSQEEELERTWRRINSHGIHMMKDFQKRNKMSMQFLLLDKERKYMKKLYQGWGTTIPMDRTDGSHQSELLDDPMYEHPIDPENEPEIWQNVTTSKFIKGVVEKLENKQAVHPHLFDQEKANKESTRNFSKLTVKQKLLQDVGQMISSNRSNVGRLRNKSVSGYTLPDRGGAQASLLSRRLSSKGSHNLASPTNPQRLRSVRTLAANSNHYDIRSYLSRD